MTDTDTLCTCGHTLGEHCYSDTFACSHGDGPDYDDRPAPCPCDKFVEAPRGLSMTDASGEFAVQLPTEARPPRDADRSTHWRADPESVAFAEQQGLLIAHARLGYNPHQKISVNLLGAKVGCSGAHLARIETGKGQCTAVMLWRIAGALEVSVGSLFPPLARR